MTDATPSTIVHCDKGHELHWFRCNNGGKNHGKIYWKSRSPECRKTFYNNNYIQAMAPYDEIEKIVRCMGS